MNSRVEVRQTPHILMKCNQSDALGLQHTPSCDKLNFEATLSKNKVSLCAYAAGAPKCGLCTQCSLATIAGPPDNRLEQSAYDPSRYANPVSGSTKLSSSRGRAQYLLDVARCAQLYQGQRKMPPTTCIESAAERPTKFVLVTF